MSSASVSNTAGVYRRLREMVLNGEIPPGTVVSQVKLARELSVSTTPLREAMRMMEGEGLLIAEHNRRSRVAPIHPADVDAVYASRILVEALAVRVSVPVLSLGDHAALRRDLAEMRRAASLRDLEQWEPIHRRFHRGLLSGCDPSFARIIEPVIDRCERYRRSTLFGSSRRMWNVGNDEHAAILDACEARDATASALLLARHLTRSVLTMLAKASPESDPVAVRSAIALIEGASGPK